jgi:hypothetical protein
MIPLRMNPSSQPLLRLPRFPAARSVLVALAAFGALTLAACSKTYIPNTDVEDTSDNRKIVHFCEEYRHAVEDKNIGKLLALASPRYHEDGGNTRGEDDIDYDGLKQYLAGVFMKTTSIRYEIKYRKVTFKEDRHILVDYTYAASYRLPGVKQEEWRHTVADNRLEIVPDGDTFKILGGM